MVVYLQKIASSFGIKIKDNFAAIDIQRIKMTAHSRRAEEKSVSVFNDIRIKIAS